MNPGAWHFADPGWLWLAAAAPLLLAALHGQAARARRAQLGRLAAPSALAALTASHQPARRHAKEALLLATMLLGGLALARPQWGRRPHPAAAAGGDVVFAVDCSLSMTTADVPPDRLERAKLAILDFTRRHPGGRLGLVAFAGTAFIQCPLTFDAGAFEETLMDLSVKTMPVPGTDIGRALREASQAMDPLARRKVVVLVTDGEDLEQTGVAAARQLAGRGVVVFTVGAGTPGGGGIQVVTPAGQPAWLRDAAGNVVHSRLDEATLRQIATVTGGSYLPLGRLGEGLQPLDEALQTLDRARDTAAARQDGVDRAGWFIGLMLALLVVEALIRTRRANPEAPV